MPSHTDELPEEIGFDQLIERLRGVVDRLEEGNLSLEDALQSYEEGVALARRGHGLLDQAEKRVELLSQNGDTEALDDDDDGGE